MPAYASLSNNNRVVIHKYCDPLKLSEIEASLNKHQAVYESATAPIHAIFDASQLIYFPKSIIDALHFISKQPDNLLDHPMAGVNIIVTMSSYVMMMASLSAGMIIESEIVVVKSMDEAWAKIDELFAAEHITPVKYGSMLRH